MARGNRSRWRADAAVAAASILVYALGVFWAYGVWTWSRTGLEVDWRVLLQGPRIAVQIYPRPYLDCLLATVVFVVATWRRWDWRTVAWVVTLAIPGVVGMWSATQMLRDGATLSIVARFARGWLLTTIPFGALASGIWALHAWRRETRG